MFEPLSEGESPAGVDGEEAGMDTAELAVRINSTKDWSWRFKERMSGRRDNA